MYRPGYVVLQVSVVVRSEEANCKEVQAFLKSVDFEYEMQEKLAHLFQETLDRGGVPFDEVMISLDQAPETAKPTPQPKPSEDKSSMLGRLFGRG
jgi:hypothetical protein